MFGFEGGDPLSGAAGEPQDGTQGDGESPAPGGLDGADDCGTVDGVDGAAGDGEDAAATGPECGDPASLDADHPDDPDAGDAVAVDPEAAGPEADAPDAVDPEAVDAARRAEVAAVLEGARLAGVRIAGEQAGQVSTWAHAAQAWPCPHQQQIDTDPDGWAHDGKEHDRRGRYPDLPASGIHEGLFGVCWEAIEATAHVLAAQTPSWTLGWSRNQVITGIRLTRSLPLTLSAWTKGVLDARQVGVILRATRELHDLDVLTRLDQALCGQGENALTLTQTLTTGALPPRITQLLAELDVQVAATASRREAASRSVRMFPDADGHACLLIRGPAPAVAEMHAAITAAGTQSQRETRHRNREGQPSLDPWALGDIDGPLDRRGADAHRFDATHTLLLGALTGLATKDTGAEGAAEDGEAGDGTSTEQTLPFPTDDTNPAYDSEGSGGSDPGSWSGRTGLAVRWGALSGLASVQLPAVLVGLTSLLGADESPAHLEGYGPLPSWMTRAMATHRGLRRFLTDPLTGHLRHLDQHTYPARHLTGARWDPDPPQDPPNDQDGDSGDGARPSGGAPGSGGPSGGGNGGGPGGRGGRGCGDAPSGEPASTTPHDTECHPLDPDDCPVRRHGAAATATGLPGIPGARPSGAYTPSTALAAFVRRQWGHCTAPGCRRRAATSDLDHTTPWPVGTTCACNLAPLCGTHHQMKHGTPHYGSGPAAAWATRAGTLPWTWTLHRCTHGHQHWTDPLGGQHTITAPTPLGPPAAEANKPRLTQPLPALTYPRPLRALPPLPAARPTARTTHLTQPWDPYAETPTF